MNILNKLSIQSLEIYLEYLVDKVSKIEKIIKQAKADIEESKCTDDTTILVAGMRWARLNLGATFDKPNGELYDFDTAQTIVPQGWKIPTKEQWKQLIKRTTSEWVTRDGVNGQLFTDKDSDNELFLPATGYRSCIDDLQYRQDYVGHYWSSLIFNNNSGYNCYFNSDIVRPDNYNVYGYGFSVRCIRK